MKNNYELYPVSGRSLLENKPTDKSPLKDDDQKSELRENEHDSPSILELGYVPVSGVYSSGWNKTIKVFNSFNLKSR